MRSKSSKPLAIQKAEENVLKNFEIGSRIVSICAVSKAIFSEKTNEGEKKRASRNSQWLVRRIQVANATFCLCLFYR